MFKTMTGQSTNRRVAKVEYSPDDTLLDSAPEARMTLLKQVEFLTKEYTHLADTLRYRSEELQSVVSDIKRLPEYKFGAKRRDTRPCENCPKLAYQNRSHEILNARLMSFTNKLVRIVPRNHAAYTACVKELQELSKLASFKKELAAASGLTEPMFGTDETAVVESLPKQESRIEEAVAFKSTKLTHRPEEMLANVTPKLASHVSEMDVNEASTIATYAGGGNLEVSPVIEQCANNKRRKKSISTKNRNKVEDVHNTIGHDSTPDFVYTENCVTRPDNIDELTTPTSTREPSLNSIEDIIEPTQKLPSRRLVNLGRRTLTFDKPNLNDATIEQLPEKCTKTTPGKTSSLNIIITSSSHTVNSFASTTKSPMKSVKAKKSDEGDESVFKNPKASADEIKKKIPEIKWNSALSRQPTKSKLKQTLLTVTTFQKKEVDMTKQEKFNRDSLRSAETKETENENWPSNKKSDENCLKSTFESTITSTVNAVVSKTPMKKGKAERC